MNISTLFPGTLCQTHYEALASAALAHSKNPTEATGGAMSDAWRKLMLESPTCDHDLDLKATAALTYKMEFIPPVPMADHPLKGKGVVRRRAPKAR